MSGSKTVWLFYYFNLKRVLKSNSPCILLNKNINFNKKETESKMENPTHSFRETSLVFQLIKESQIKSKTVISWSSRKKKEGIFCTVYFVRREFFFLRIKFLRSFFCVLSHALCIEYTFRLYNILKNITSYTFVACF